MAGQKFQYDESGGTFFYFLLAFTALLIIPATLWCWPKKKKIQFNHMENCYCEPCSKKLDILNATKPWSYFKEIAIKMCIIFGWIFMAFLLYKISKLDYEMVNFDPYEILGISVGSSSKDIKRAYRKLSVILHPDKETGDEKAFMRLTKAYQALTNEESRKNWENYGNPDGPGAMSFGIALPAWIVEKQNSFWVLGVYVLVIMIALPTTVGFWWYKSMRFSSDKILLKTIKIYSHFFGKTPGVSLKKVIMILAGSLEFEHGHNSEIVQRVTDEKEISVLKKQFDSFNEKVREPPLYYPYSIKARAIIYAQLSRLPLNPLTLELDRQYIIEKCPYLLLEMLNVVNYLILLAYAKRNPVLPCIETIENVMKVHPMIIQGLWDTKSPFLQLPHILEDHLKHFTYKRKQLRTLKQLAWLRNTERRAVLSFLSDVQYENVVKVLAKMPSIELNTCFEVIDDEKPQVITVGSLITVTVTLKRTNMEKYFGDNMTSARTTTTTTAATTTTTATANQKQQVSEGAGVAASANGKNENESNNGVKFSTAAANNTVNRKTFKKSNNKKNKKYNKKNNKGYNNNKNANKQKKSDSEHESGGSDDECDDVSLNGNNNNNNNADENEDAVVSSTMTTTTKVNNVNGGAVDEQNNESSSDESSRTPALVTVAAAAAATPAARNVDEPQTAEVDETTADVNDDDDKEWDRIQKKMQKRDKYLEGKSMISHTVHCPYYPAVKQEYWWIYVCDRKSRTLLTAPCHVTNLVDEEEYQLRFSAPNWPGRYVFTVCLRSDSYLGMDMQEHVEVNVKQAAAIPCEHPQWSFDDSETEEQNQAVLQESEYATDDDIADD